MWKKIITTTILSSLTLSSYAQDNICSKEGMTNLKINYSVKNNILKYNVTEKNHNKFKVVNLSYIENYEYLGLKLKNEPTKAHAVNIVNFVVRDNNCSNNINKLFDNYSWYSSLLDSRIISQLYQFLLTNNVIEPPKLSNTVNLKYWLYSMKNIMPEVHEKQPVEIYISLFHDPYLKQQTIFKINTVLDFDSFNVNSNNKWLN